MKELICQNYNHPCIVCWGVSNEITISTKDKADMLDNHRELNDLCHEMDPTRLTTLACYAMCGPFNPVGPYHRPRQLEPLPGLVCAGPVPERPVDGLLPSRASPTVRSASASTARRACRTCTARQPRRGDHTEEYQAVYHEYMLRCFERHPWMWATHVWNMFDFAADARDQGGEPGMNHKGLVTFDRKTKKDSFYLYKAWWSE